MTPLERRYRRLLVLLPGDYRAVWEEDMVAAFMQTVYPDDEEESWYVGEFGRPGWRETAGVVRLAVGLRLGGLTASPRSYLVGEGVRRAALIGLLVFALTLPSGAVQLAWIRSDLPLPAPIQQALVDSPPAELWQSDWALFGALWLVAYLALATNRFSVGRWIAVVGFAYAAVGTLWRAVASALESGGEPFVITPWFFLAALGCVAAATAAFHADAPAVDTAAAVRRLAWGTVACAVPAVAALFQPVDLPLLLDGSAALCAAWLVAAVVAAAARHRDRDWTPESMMALALLAVPVVALRAASTVDLTLTGNPLPLLSLGVVVVQVVLIALLAAKSIARAHPVEPIGARDVPR